MKDQQTSRARHPLWAVAGVWVVAGGVGLSLAVMLYAAIFDLKNKTNELDRLLRVVAEQDFASGAGRYQGRPGKGDRGAAG